MSFVKPEALDSVRGAALFYPVAGTDCRDAIACFAPFITDFGFVDVNYFTSRPADAVPPLIGGSSPFEFQGFTLDGPAIARHEVRVDAVSGTSYRFLEPCTRSEVYSHTPTSSLITVNRRRGYGQRSILQVQDIGVFFHRGDSRGEGGSCIYWLSKRMWPLIGSRMRQGGLIASDGSMTKLRPRIRQFSNKYLSVQIACEESAYFDKWGFRWTCVGWVSNSERPKPYHPIAFDRPENIRGEPTPVWQLTVM
jgi:hypothetical protein